MTLAPRRLCLLVAALYSTWIIAPLLDRELKPWTSYASEYFVAGRPAAALLRTTDGLSGVLLVVIAVMSYTRIRILWRGLPVEVDGVPGTRAPIGPTRRRARTAVRAWCAAVTVAGLATVVDAVNPMTCAPSLSHSCARADAEGTLPLQHEMHTTASAMAGLAFMAAMLASLALCRGADHWVRVTSWLGLVTITLSGIDAIVTRIPTEGITQRISMVVIVVWFVATAGLPVVERLRAEPTPSDPDPA